MWSTQKFHAMMESLLLSFIVQYRLGVNLMIHFSIASKIDQVIAYLHYLDEAGLQQE